MTNPLAELKERLTYSAVAGTALLEEDFRLKKCMDAFAPLAQKNAVFGKIYDSLTELFAAEPEQRGKLLLHLLGLVDAVLYTQAGYGAEGDFTALPENAGLSGIHKAPYSVLYPLTEARTIKSSEKIKVLIDTIAEKPEYFKDPRMIDALIRNLAGVNGYLTSRASNTLQALAEGQPFKTHESDDRVNYEYTPTLYQLPELDRKQLILQLKHGFDPAGKWDMKTRLRLIALLAGAEENDWYLSLLDTAQKDIRALAIFCLGYTKENIPLLLELAKKERRNAKEMAYRALAQWDTPEVLAFLESALEKDTALAACLSSTALDVYGDMAAKHLRAALEKVLDTPWIPREQMDGTITPWIWALTNKASKEVLALYQWISEQQARIPEVQDVCYHGELQNTAMLPLFEEKIWKTLILRCPPALTDFLAQAWKVDDKFWESACFLADIMTLPATALYEKWNRYDHEVMYDYFTGIVYNENECCVTYVIKDANILSVGTTEHHRCALKEPLDLRWIDVFIKNDWEHVFRKIDPKLPAVWRKKIGAYLCQCALHPNQEKSACYHAVNLRRRMKIMYQCGWQEYTDILVNLCKCYPDIQRHQLREAFSAYQKYAGQENTEREGGRVLEFYRNTPECAISADTVSEMLRKDGFFRESEK